MHELQEFLCQVQQHLSRGDYLLAYDLCEKAMAEGKQDLSVKYLSVLSLAKSGALNKAIIRYRQLDLEQYADTAGVPRQLALDVQALWARLLKEHALRPGNGAQLKAAALAYEEVFNNHGGSYPAVNAATLWLLADHPEAAGVWADKTLSVLADERKHGAPDYWHVVTEAEARLVRNEVERVGPLLHQAAQLVHRNWAMLSTSCRQLSLITTKHGLDASLLEVLRPPAVIHYSGHMLGKRFMPTAEASVAASIRRELETNRVGFGFGSLAAGADILFAEALLERGAELNIILPFNVKDFVEISVAPAGDDWVRRFERCLAGATCVVHVTDDGHSQEEALFIYCSRIGIGSALMRAKALSTHVFQLVVWDGEATPMLEAGTAGDVAQWRCVGRRMCRRIDPSDGTVSDDVFHLRGEESLQSCQEYSLREMVFGEVKGHGKPDEAHLPLFVSEVMRRLARILEPYGENVIFPDRLDWLTTVWFLQDPPER